MSCCVGSVIARETLRGLPVGKTDAVVKKAVASTEDISNEEYEEVDYDEEYYYQE